MGGAWQDGELQAVNNIDVVNKVEGLNTIQELVKEGTFVHKGDVLVTLDASNIQKNYDQSLLDLQAAEAALSAAREAKEIQESTNSANLQFYRSHGFDIAESSRTPGGLAYWPMLRQ